MGNQFKGATIGHLSTTAYYRLSLSSLLPNLDKIIYIDSDTLNFKDLSEIYDLELEDKTYFYGLLDHIELLNELKRLGYYTDKYINSGILLINLKAIRKDFVEQKIKEFVATHFLEHHEQTAINVICKNALKILSIKYARFSFNSFKRMIKYNKKQKKLYQYKKSELIEGFNEPTLIHFAGRKKPWHKKYKNPNKKYWWYFAKISCIYHEILDFYGFKKEEVEELLKNIPNDGGLLKKSFKK